MQQGGSGVEATESPCDVYSDPAYLAISVTRASLALFSFVCCGTVVFLILFYKQYGGFVQRLILYTCVASALNSLSIVTQKVDYFGANSATEVYCVIAGFISQYTSLVELLAVLGLVLGLYVNIFHRKLRRRVEVLCVLLVLMIPALVSWVPFINLSYGSSGPWCWIREKEQNCERYVMGLVLQYLLWYLPLFTVVITVLCMYSCAYYKLRKIIKGTYARPYDPEVQLTREQLQKHKKQWLLYIPLLYLVFTLLALPNAIHRVFKDEPRLELWLIQAVTVPLRGALFAIPYILNKHTRNKISRTKLWVRNSHGSKKGRAVNPYPAMDANFSDSLYYAHKDDNTLERENVYRNPSLSHSPLEAAPSRNGKDSKMYNVPADSGTRVAAQEISIEH